MKMKVKMRTKMRMMHRAGCYFLWGLLVLALGLPLSAAEERFDFSGNKTSIVFAEGRERTQLSGNARIVSGDTIIEAESIEIFGEDFRYALCAGGVNTNSSKHGYSLSSQTLYFDREADILRAEGGTIMEDTENELVIKSELLENRNNENIAIAQIGVRILGEDLIARSEFARYRRDDNILELTGLPVIFWKEDEYRAARVVVNLEDDTISLQGEVSGAITTKDPDEEDATPAAAQTATEQPSTGEQEENVDEGQDENQDESTDVPAAEK